VTTNSKTALARPRWRKVFADLWENKLRTLLVVASIAVGVFAVGTIASTYVIFSEDLTISYAASNPTNIDIWTDYFDENFVKTIENLPEVSQAEGRYILNVRLRQEGGTWKNHDLVAIEDFEDSNINLVNPLEGKTIPGPRELVIERNALNESVYHTGEVLQLQLEDNTIQEIPVVGIVQDPTGAGGDFLAAPKGYITMDTLEWLDQPRQFNHIFATVSGDPDDKATIEHAADAIEDKIEKSGRTVYYRKTNFTHKHPMEAVALTILAVLGVLGVMITLLSSSLIANTLNALLSQQMRQIGVMKLVGARSTQISSMYIVLILAFGFFALLIAVPTGVNAGYALANFAANFLNITLQGFRVVPLAIVLQVLIALGIPLLAGYFPVNRGAKTTVRRAISDDPQGGQPSNTNLVAKLLGRIRWISRPILLSIRNTFRRKGRLALTLFTLITGGAIFISVFNLRVSLEGFLDLLSDHFGADLTIELEQPYRTSEVEAAVLQVPDVQGFEAWSYAPAEILNPDGSLDANLHILAPPAHSKLISPDIIEGRWFEPGEPRALALADGIRELYPNLKAGDTLRLEVADQREEDWTVVGIFRFSSPVDEMFGYADYETISEIHNLRDRSSSYRIVTRNHTLADQENAARAVDSALRSAGFKVSNIEPGLLTLSEASEGINILVVLLLLMALLSALVGSIGLTGTMSMNVLERTREIGVMRAIGAGNPAIIKSVIIEGAMIGLISWVFAAIVSLPFSMLLIRIMSDSMFNALVPLKLAPFGYLIWLVVVLVLSALASLLPARSAANLTIREVLAYE
jgi:putative ABC transport system permease protein